MLIQHLGLLGVSWSRSKLRLLKLLMGHILRTLLLLQLLFLVVTLRISALFECKSLLKLLIAWNSERRSSWRRRFTSILLCKRPRCETILRASGVLV